MVKRESRGGSKYRLVKMLTCVRCKHRYEMSVPIPDSLWNESDNTVNCPATACPKCGRWNVIRIKIGTLRKMLSQLLTSQLARLDLLSPVSGKRVRSLPVHFVLSQFLPVALLTLL